MNFKQRAMLRVSAIAIALMALFPPWYITFQIENTKLGQRFAGYHPIWQANTPTDSQLLSAWFSQSVSSDLLQYFSIHIDTTRLIIQISVTVVIVLLLCASFAGTESSKLKEQLLDNLKV